MDPRKRQKKLARAKAKKVKNRKQQQAAGGRQVFLERLQRDAAAPVLDTLVTESIWDEGLGSVLVSRELGSGACAFSIFLVDVYCLGVKNAMFDIASRGRYDELLQNWPGPGQTAEALSPAEARALVEGAVDYAAKLGLTPHRDYQFAKAIFGDIDATDCDQEFEFGRDGEPFFVAGPHDSPGRCIQVIESLVDHCGEDGFDYLMPLSAGAMRGPGARTSIGAPASRQLP